MACDMGLGDRVLCGLRVRSAIPLPELEPWSGAADAPADVSILEADVPAPTADAVPIDRWASLAADGSVLIDAPGLVRLLIRDGREIAVQLARGAGQDWKLHLLGSAFGALYHQRGLYPLHAATVRLDGRAIAIIARSGAGKSTLALHLAERGHAVVADDATVLAWAGGRIEVSPALRRMKLWRASLEAARIDGAGLARVSEGIEKFYLEPPTPFDLTPSPLGAVVVLAEGERPLMQRLPPDRAFAAVRSHVYRVRIGTSLQGGEQRLFARSAQLVDATPVYRLDRPKRFEALPEMSALVEAAGRQGR